MTCLLFLSPNVVLSETLDDLVSREGFYYKKFSQVPFNGELTGQVQGTFKNGKKDGDWVTYWNNRQLMIKKNYKNGKQDGAWVSYWSNGQVWSKGNYKNGKKEGAWVDYYDNGELMNKGNYKNDKIETWISYNMGGTVNKDFTRNYLNQ